MAIVSQASPLTPARRRAQELAASGELAGARAMLEKAVELGKANLAEDDPDVLLTAYQLGQVCQRLDDQPAARRVLEEAYAAGQWKLGDSDPLMVEISHDIGVVAEELGNRHEARKAFTRVAQYGPAALGATHQAVARAQAYLGHTPDSVRPPAPPTALAGSPETHLTLVTPVPSAPMFDQPGSGEPTAARPPVAPARPAAGLVKPPPPIDPVWTPPAPSSRRSPGAVDEPTAAHQIITPRAESAGPARPAPPATYGADQAGVDRPAVEPVPQFGGPGSGQPGAGFERPGQSLDRSAPQVPAQRLADQQWAPPPPHHLLVGSAGYPAGTAQPGPAPSGGDGAYRKRGLGLFAAIAAVLASLIAVVALVVVLANRKTDSPPASNVPTLAGRAPTGIKLHDLGSEVDVTWTDPSPGQVSFIVVMAHPGEQFRSMATLGPGTTSYSAGGLSARLNYCFAVAAVYGVKTFATSSEICTSRAAASSAPSTGK
jgi:hypothetical protein